MKIIEGKRYYITEGMQLRKCRVIKNLENHHHRVHVEETDEILDLSWLKFNGHIPDTEDIYNEKPTKKEW